METVWPAIPQLYILHGHLRESLADPTLSEGIYIHKYTKYSSFVSL